MGKATDRFLIGRCRADEDVLADPVAEETDVRRDMLGRVSDPVDHDVERAVADGGAGCLFVPQCPACSTVVPAGMARGVLVPRFRKVSSMPCDTARAAQAALILPVPPMKRTLSGVIRFLCGVGLAPVRGRPCAHKHLAVDELTLGGKLLDEIEFVPIGGQHGNANFGCGQENQRIVQTLLTLIRLKPRRAGQRAGDDAGIRPDLRIGRRQPA